MSKSTLAPAATTQAFATTTPVTPALSAPGAEPRIWYSQRMAAELALTELEHAVQDLSRRLSVTPAAYRPIDRRSRRSAWWSASA